MVYPSALLAVSVLSATVSAATCISASAATANTTDSSLTLADYTTATAPVSGTGYDIDASFQASYAFNSTMALSLTHSSNASDYASFKCQFACNGNEGCASFFGRYVNVDTDQESYECLSFTAILDSTSFTTTTANIAGGGYNKLC
ncbi:unnamed protein product [Discula destructiva]